MKKAILSLLVLLGLAVSGCGKGGAGAIVKAMSHESKGAIWTEPGWGVAHKGQAMKLTKDGRLEVRVWVCDSWAGLEACEKDDKWQQGGGRLRLAEINPASIRVGKSPDGKGFRVSYRCRGDDPCWTDANVQPDVLCKSEASCAKQAEHFVELIALTQK